MKKLRQLLLITLSLGLMLLLGGCSHMALLNPKGVVAAAESKYLIMSTCLMLIIVIPVIILVFIVAWRYRRKNTKAKYSPNWAHNNLLEAVWWTVPCIIIVVLAIITWISTHELNPYKPIHIQGKKPLTIQVIALNWKWLFIYPKQGVATINAMPIPVNTPIKLYITSDAPMNSLEIPQLAGQIYAMGGMRTTLYLVANHVGNYAGLSTNYSGNGFAGMKFRVNATSEAKFKQWVETAKKASKAKLDQATYHQLVKPSKNNKVEYFSPVQAGLFEHEIKKFMKPYMRKPA